MYEQKALFVESLERRLFQWMSAEGVEHWFYHPQGDMEFAPIDYIQSERFHPGGFMAARLMELAKGHPIE